MTFDPSSFINEKIKVMPPSGIRKFFDIVATMDGAISLGVGEPDFVTPWSVRDAGIYSLEKGKTHYTSNSGMMELREEICNYLKRRFNLSYNYKETLVAYVSEFRNFDIRTAIYRSGNARRRRGLGKQHHKARAACKEDRLL